MDARSNSNCLYAGSCVGLRLRGLTSAATIKIMRLYMEVPLNLLLHGYETVSPSGGPFAWCPMNLLNGTPATLSNTPSRSDLEGNILVDNHGAAIGGWRIRMLTAEDKRTPRPHAMHLSVQYRVEKALQDKWDHCLLLYSDPGKGNQHPALLLAVAGICWPQERYATPFVSGPYIDGHYIGCVFDNNPPGESYEHLWGIRIGCDADKPTTSSKEIVDMVRALSRSRIMRQAYAGRSPFDSNSESDFADGIDRRFDTGFVRSYGGVGRMADTLTSEEMSERTASAPANIDRIDILWDTVTGFTEPRGFQW
ncbi:hypothetical protein FSARC_3671 [Fusarium sarcochroum]|uniref:Uncharacterized protein n=1 Tax=Fusarium sarcochroum TaxID=1208366 RepID=A0A8H4XBL4_9HYPO|nr:hypothetical protein FSARC_3671 [Fusarium sarcochroum]